MKLRDENQILDKDFRFKVIEEITGRENIMRKQKHLRAHEMYKDKIKKWVVNQLSQEFSEDTVIQMLNRAANVSILKKVVNKLARAYSDGVDRAVYKKTAETKTPVESPDQERVKDEASTAIVQELTEALYMNHQMKLVDRYLYPHRNALLMVLPEKNTRESTPESEKYDLCARVLSPHLYDVIPDAYNEERAKVLILTDFVEQSSATGPSTTYEDGKTPKTRIILDDGDRKEQLIANAPSDRGTENRTFIWWSDNYHFTTNGKGEIIPEVSPQDGANPIGRIPGVFFAVDQDGSFWAEGGDDLVDGALMINIELTDLYVIKNVQGWGQPVLIAGQIDKDYKGGPHRLLKLKAEKGDPEPKFEYVSSNPPLDQHMRSIEMSAALYLSTNNLAPSNISGKLDANTFPSGIAQMVENAQSTEPVIDRQKYFKDKEPEVWEVVSLWQKRYFASQNLTREYMEIGLLQESDVEVTFHTPKPVITEAEHLANLKLRKDLGINTMIDLIKMDNPELTDAQAEERLGQINQEKDENAQRLQKQMQDQQRQDPQAQDQGTEIGHGRNPQDETTPAAT